MRAKAHPVCMLLLSQHIYNILTDTSIYSAQLPLSDILSSAQGVQTYCQLVSHFLTSYYFSCSLIAFDGLITIFSVLFLWSIIVDMLVNWHVTGYISKLPFVTEPALLNDPHDMVFFLSVHRLHRSYKFHTIFNGTLSWQDVNLHGLYLVCDGSGHFNFEKDYCRDLPLKHKCRDSCARQAYVFKCLDKAQLDFSKPQYPSSKDLAMASAQTRDL